jgi:hypothetical protein
MTSHTSSSASSGVSGPYCARLRKARSATVAGSAKANALIPRRWSSAHRAISSSISPRSRRSAPGADMSREICLALSCTAPSISASGSTA